MNIQDKGALLQRADRSPAPALVTLEDLEFFKQDLLEAFKLVSKELMEQGGKKWLRSRDVKRLLGISHGTLQNMRNSRDLPYSKVGGVMFYDITEVYNMIESNRIE